MLEWVKTAFEQTGYRPAAMPLAFLLGLVSAAASACCTLPILGAIAGYSGTQKDCDRRARLFIAAFFMLGTVLALVALGAVAGFVGQAAQAWLGKYWKVFAGLLAIAVGLATLDLLPFKLPQGRTKDGMATKGFFGAAAFGFVAGGGVSVASLACNPGIFIILGVAVLEGHVYWATAIMGAFAVGFSLPLTAIVLGVSFGASAVKARRAERGIRAVAGILLIGAGFYFLGTV